MKCPKCGSEMRKGLSFCPKCGEVVNQKQESLVQETKQEKKRTPAWLIVLAVLFFPISLTYIILKSKKLKKPIKVVLVILLWAFVIGIGNSEDSETPDTNVNQEQQVDENKNESDKKNDTEENKKEEEVVKYHKDKGVNQILVDYNKIAEIKITPDMVQDGAYNNNANISVNEVWVQIYNSSNGLFVDYSDEANSDEHIYPLFRDFSKALNPSLTDEIISNAWKELQTGKYDYYSNKYDLSGIEIAYMTSKLNNGQLKYTIKTGLKK